MPYEVKPLKPRPYLLILPLWGVLCILGIYVAGYMLAFLNVSALDYVFRWLGLSGK
ncbi:hypothetical protein GCM10011408_11190 [Dyella caseinilytica]|nr:hypothetical protein GCM10011408_11190 [Dyella caseinilytica]